METKIEKKRSDMTKTDKKLKNMLTDFTIFTTEVPMIEKFSNENFLLKIENLMSRNIKDWRNF